MLMPCSCKIATLVVFCVIARAHAVPTTGGVAGLFFASSSIRDDLPRANEKNCLRTRSCASRASFRPLPRRYPTQVTKVDSVGDSSSLWFATGSIPRGGSNVDGPTTPTASFLDLISDTKWKCWTTLVISILIENFASALIKAARVRKSAPLLLLSCLLFLLGNLGLFAAVDKIDIGIAYAVWSALGTTVLTTVGILFFDEASDWIKLGCIFCIILGVVGLNLREEH